MRYKVSIAYFVVWSTFIIVPVCFAATNLSELELSSTEQAENKLLHLPTLEVLPIAESITDLLESLQQESNYSADIKTKQLLANSQSFNFAEQYLLLIAQALLAHAVSDSKPDSELIIQLLEQAKALEQNISKEQLSQPLFLQLHILLAEHYAILLKFDLAYLEKRTYLEKYRLYRKNKRIRMIASLEQTFEIDDKKANNALLISENKLKEQRVAKVEKEQQDRQYNFTLIIATVFVIVLLFFRQLKIREKLIVLTKTDALTGLANRSALFGHGRRMIETLVDKPSNLSILLLDLDHFKKVNDNFGHHIGDEVLIKVTELVKETMRSRDVFARLGGEEFVALLPFADANKAKAIAMRINDKIAQYDFSSLMLQSKVTVSIGVATMENNSMSFDDLLHGADLAMYQAKEQGRNTVVCYQNIAVTQERRGN